MKSAPEEVSCDFTVRAEPVGNGVRFEVRCDGQALVRSYHVPSVDQNAYLDFFQALATDFGTRMPRNRRPAPEFAAGSPCQPLLQEAVSPDILYGYGDPAVLRVEGSGGPVFYLVVTSNDAPHAFPILRSHDLRSWELVSHVFREGETPDWAAAGAHVSDFWAPELHKVGEHYLLCFAARETDGSLSIGIARSDAPEGPFTPPERPLLRGHVIDPHILVTEEGPFLFWKEDSNGVWPRLLALWLHEDPTIASLLFSDPEDFRTAAFVSALWPWLAGREPMEQFFLLQPLIEAVVDRFGPVREALERMRDGAAAQSRERIDAIVQAMRTPVFAQRLSADGTTLLGDPVTVLVNDLAWEGHLIEGVWATEQEGRYYLFYSGNDFSTADYGIGVAIAPIPMGPYRKVEQPLLKSTADWWAPGHPSVAIGPDGVPRLFLHAFHPGQAGYKVFRALLSVGLTFHEQGVSLRT